ncbi:ribosome biogenesis protein SLX9-domain-containing protein [Gilbertella persicaria]|uniref:ribosome biogenesis protein SLX9-domain-containing protein n=1 Tax=Gilbertella persicaria TaxID=101096 RepID=UPI002220924C|nr:ribosome biogenesis protein SLX9-domain-containing protein [Gilbertella persicaria]KAI8047074.1 ribosome biogenesis protein SLX9-domain-containing protein [Gilbertella persicaria]
MPKATRSRSLKKADTPLRQRKFAVSEKQVLERIVTEEEQISTVPAHAQETLKKDEKKKKRHEEWLQKLDRSYVAKKKMQKKQDKKTNLNVDLGGIGDILNDIQVKPKSEFASQATHEKKLENKQPAIPSNKIKSKKAKKQAELQEMLRMQKVMQHGAFKQNPLDTIRQHVQNTFS